MLEPKNLKELHGHLEYIQGFISDLTSRYPFSQIIKKKAPFFKEIKYLSNSPALGASILSKPLISTLRLKNNH